MTDSNVSTANPAGLKRYPVLIAGGGPVGLALAIELGWRGIHCLVVEQGDGTVDFPTTNLANTRTCEHLRRWGLADRMRYDSGYPTDYPRNYVFVTRMNGYEVARFDHPSPPPPLDHGLYVPSTWPGVRAPHVWLRDGRSTLDLFGKGFTLLVLSSQGIDGSAFTDAARQAGLPLDIVSLDELQVREVYERPLVLVRPDGHVAWRGDAVPANAPEIIDQVRGARQ